MHVRWWLLLSVGILAPRSTPSVAGCNTDAWRAAIGQYARGHPRAEAADLYKLAHQGIMGSEHALKDAAAASDWMRRELVTRSKSAAAVNEDLLEPLPPDARFARVNLRPFIAAGGNPEALVRAFVATANESKGDTAQFACVERALGAT